MTVLRTLEVQLRANVSGYTAALGTASAQTKAFGRDVTGTLTSTDKGVQASLQRVSRGSLLMGGAALAGFGVAVGAASNFERAMSGVAAVSGSTAAEMKQLSDAALQAGKDTVFSASEAAGAQAELVKAGVSTAEVLGGALTGALSLAAAGQIDVAQSATIAAQAMNIFGLRGSEVGHVADQLAGAANATAADVAGLGDALRQGGLVAAQAGLSFDETVVTLGIFADNALIGSDAGTSLKTMLQQLAGPSEKSANLMKELGFDVYNAQGNFIGLDALGQELTDTFSGLTQEQRDQSFATIFGADAVRAANILYREGAQGIGDYRENITDLADAEAMAAKQLDNLSGDIEALKGSIETALIQGGSSATGMLRGVTQGATNVVNAFSDMPSSFQSATFGILGFGGAALGAVGVIGTMVPKVQAAREALRGLGDAGVAADQGLGRLGKVAGYAAALATMVVVAGQLSEVLDNRLANVDMGPLAKQLTELAESGAVGSELAALFGGDLERLAEDARLAGHEVGDIFDRTQGVDVLNARADIEALDEALASVVTAGYADQAEEMFNRLAAAVSANGGNVDDLTARLSGYSEAQANASAQAALAADEQAANVDPALAAAGATSEITTALEDPGHRRREGRRRP